MLKSARQLAFEALYNIHQQKAYTDIALEKIFSHHEISSLDRHLLSELVYGVVRRKRTLNSLINQLATKKASQQPLNLLVILQLGLYQLRYLDKIPPSAIVHTSVELAKRNGMGKIAGVVNGILRAYLRKSDDEDFLILPNEKIPRLGVKYSFPDWIVSVFLDQFSYTDTEKLLQWFNIAPQLDLRVNCLQTTREDLQSLLLSYGIQTEFLPHLPQGLRIIESAGNLAHLGEFSQGLFTIQDGSAQLVTHLLNPQPQETIIDACAAPGGKTTHIAELMADKGKIIAIDCHQSRLNKIEQNQQRLQLNSIETCLGDSSKLVLEEEIADKVIVDVPCSGLGTIHKNPDIRWHKKPDQIKQLNQLQKNILGNASRWVKKGGVMVYATCTLNRRENENIVNQFLLHHPQWHLEDIKSNKSNSDFSITSESIVKIFPPTDKMDGFFMAKLIKGY